VTTGIASGRPIANSIRYNICTGVGHVPAVHRKRPFTNNIRFNRRFAITNERRNKRLFFRIIDSNRFARNLIGNGTTARKSSYVHRYLSIEYTRPTNCSSSLFDRKRSAGARRESFRRFRCDSRTYNGRGFHAGRPEQFYSVGRVYEIRI